MNDEIKKIKEKMEEIKSLLKRCLPGDPNVHYLHEDYRELSYKLRKLEGK